MHVIKIAFVSFIKASMCLSLKCFDVYWTYHAYINSFIYAVSVCSSRTSVSAAIYTPLYNCAALALHMYMHLTNTKVQIILLLLSGVCLLCINNNLHPFHLKSIPWNQCWILGFLIRFGNNYNSKYHILCDMLLFWLNSCRCP